MDRLAQLLWPRSCDVLVTSRATRCGDRAHKRHPVLHNVTSFINHSDLKRRVANTSRSVVTFPATTELAIITLIIGASPDADRTRAQRICAANSSEPTRFPQIAVTGRSVPTSGFKAPSREQCCQQIPHMPQSLTRAILFSELIT